MMSRDTHQILRPGWVLVERNNLMSQDIGTAKSPANSHQRHIIMSAIGLALLIALVVATAIISKNKLNAFVTNNENYIMSIEIIFLVIFSLITFRPAAEYNPLYIKTVTFQEANMAEKEIGMVSDFFARPMVAGIKLTGNIKLGERLHFKGHTTDFTMTVASMQIDNKNITEAKNGQTVGIQVPDRVRPGDMVFSAPDNA